MLKFKKVSEDSLEDLGEYLELGYTPESGRVEDWEGQDEVESLVVEWSDGNRIYSRECNQNLDILENIIYEEE